MIDCKHNQRAAMTRWLEQNAWPFVVDRNGLPKVLRAFRDWKLGIRDERPCGLFTFALLVSRHETLKAVARVAEVLGRKASVEDQKLIGEALNVALDSVDGVINTTRHLVERAPKNG